MRVFLTGGTGFLGRALTLALNRRGHGVVAWTRSPGRARALLGDQAELADAGGGPVALRGALAGCDAVVNLAGEPILARWTARRRREIAASRIGTTEALVREIEGLGRRPRVFLSGSAVGFYGDRGVEALSESSPRGSGFLADLCSDWEAAARRVEDLGLRCALVRTGIVLGHDGGALPSLLAPFQLGLGGRVGSGRQFFPWIHVEDWVRLVLFALEDERVSGPLNATAPQPVTNREFTRLLARAVAKPAPFPVPGLVLAAVLGGAARVLLDGQRALPVEPERLGFRFAFPDLESALRDLVGDSSVRIEPLVDEPPAAAGSAYLTQRGPTHRLEARTELGVPLAEAFRFFSNPENLGVLTPRTMGFEIRQRSGAPATGSTIDYRIRLGPFPLRWRTCFEDWRERERFVDVQERGPYRCWWHEHRFQAQGDGTRMDDLVLYAAPLGWIGRLANRIFLADRLRAIFAQRRLAIRLRFGAEREKRLSGEPARVCSA